MFVHNLKISLSPFIDFLHWLDMQKLNLETSSAFLQVTFALYVPLLLNICPVLFKRGFREAPFGVVPYRKKNFIGIYTLLLDR